LHAYVDPKDNIEKASHLLKDCRQFLDIQRLCEEIRSNAEAMAHPIRERAVDCAQPQYSPADDIYVPAEAHPVYDDIYIPAEVYPTTPGHVNMIHKTIFQREKPRNFRGR
jgi:hypothetical protein